MFQLVVFSQNYIYSADISGGYKLKNPYADAKNIYVTDNDKLCYEPYLMEDGHLFVYCEKNKDYVLTKNKTKCNHIKNQLSESEVINERKYFRNTVPPNTTNWFHEILNKGQLFSFKKKTDHFKEIIPVTITLFNFSKTNAQVRIESIRHKEKVFTVFGESQEEIVFPAKINENEVKFQLIASQEIGIKSIKLNNKHKLINHDRHSQVYHFPYRIESEGIHKNLYYFENSKLKRYSEAVLSSIQQLFYSTGLESLEIRPTSEICPESTNNLIIYHPIFEKRIKEVKNIFQQQHKKVLAYSIEDVLLFSNKYNSKQNALKDFIFSCNAKYCLLLGDASIDKNATNNLIPALEYVTKNNTKILTDYYYCYDTNPKSPEVIITRLPFNNTNDLDNYLGNYKRSKDLNKNILILDDLNKIAKPLKNKYSTYSSNGLKNKMNKIKPNLLIHLGHGNEKSWKNKNKITINSFKEIDNDFSYDLIDLSCWTGVFGHRKFDSFSESLLKLNEGGPNRIISSYGYLSTASLAELFWGFYVQSNLNFPRSFIEAKKYLIKNKNIDVDELHSLNLFGI